MTQKREKQTKHKLKKKDPVAAASPGGGDEGKIPTEIIRELKNHFHKQIEKLS